MPDGLYDADILAWSEQQADLLRRLARGERVNDAIHWANVVDEVETVGRSELRACQGLLRQAMVHLIELHAWPNSRSAGHWRAEIAGLLSDAQDSFAPSMRQRIVLARLYARTSAQASDLTDESGEPQATPESCPFSLDDLLAEPVNVPALVAKLG